MHGDEDRQPQELACELLRHEPGLGLVARTDDLGGSDGGH